MQVRKIKTYEWDFIQQQTAEAGVCEDFWGPDGYLKISSELRETTNWPNFVHLIMEDKRGYLVGVFHGRIDKGTLTCISMNIWEYDREKEAALIILFLEKIKEFSELANFFHDEIYYITLVEVKISSRKCRIFETAILENYWESHSIGEQLVLDRVQDDRPDRVLTMCIA